MKTKRKTKAGGFYTRILLFLLVAANSAVVTSMAQTRDTKSFIKGNFNINASWHHFSKEYNGVALGVAYGANNWLEAGFFTTYWTRERQELGRDHLLSYGAEAKTHFLSIFWPSLHWVDVYATPRIGASTFWDYSEGTFKKKTSFLMGIAGGIGVNFAPYIGVFFEYGMNTNQKWDIRTEMRVGLNIRFPGPKKWTEKLK